jgi:hypothetical protein
VKYLNKKSQNIQVSGSNHYPNHFGLNAVPSASNVNVLFSVFLGNASTPCSAAMDGSLFISGLGLPMPQQVGSNFMPPPPKTLRIRNDGNVPINVTANAVNVDVPDNVQLVCAACPNISVDVGQTKDMYLMLYMRPKDDNFYNNQPFDYCFDIAIKANQILVPLPPNPPIPKLPNP